MVLKCDEMEVQPEKLKNFSDDLAARTPWHIHSIYFTFE
jgi:hypothetical protein